MKDKLLSVYVDNKEVYYVKQINKKTDMDGNTKACAVFDSNDNIIHVYTLEINAYIAAVEYGLEKGDGNCIAYYPNETITYKNYQMFCRTL